MAGLEIEEWLNYRWPPEIVGAMEIFCLLIVLVVSWVCTSVKVHFVAHLKCMQFIVPKIYFSKVDKNKKK